MHVGIHTNEDYATKLKQLGGRLTMARVFPDGMPVDVTKTSVTAMQAAIRKAVNPVVAAGLIPFFSFKFVGEPATVTSGFADAYLIMIKAMTNDKTIFPLGVYAAWHHEDDTTSISAANYVAQYVYIDKRIANSNLMFGPIYDGYVWRSKAFDQTWLPPTMQMDFIGLDTYTSDWSGNQIPLGSAEGVQALLAHTPASVPLMFTERGISSGVNLTPKAGNQAAVINADYTFIKQLRLTRAVMGYLYWDSTGATDKTSSYKLTADGMAALTAMANAENPVAAPEPPALPLTSNGVPYYTPTTPQTLVGAPTDVCGRCFCPVIASKIEDHANTMHPAVHS